MISSNEDDLYTTNDLLKKIDELHPSLPTASGIFIDVLKKNFKLAHEKVVEGDFMTHDMSVALDHLWGFIRYDKLTLESGNRQSKEKAIKWRFRRSLHVHFDKTLDDVLISFLRWSSVAVHGIEGNFLMNVSMAFRRLETYSRWLENDSHLFYPLNAHFEMNAQNVMKDHVQYNYDDSGRFLLWLDFSPRVMSNVQVLSSKERYCALVWIMHLMMFDEKAQRNGSIIVRNASKIKTKDYFAYLSMDMCLSYYALSLSACSVKVVYDITIQAHMSICVFFSTISRFIPADVLETIGIREDDGKEDFKWLCIDQFIPNGFIS